MHHGAHTHRLTESNRKFLYMIFTRCFILHDLNRLKTSQTNIDFNTLQKVLNISIF